MIVCDNCLADKPLGSYALCKESGAFFKRGGGVRIFSLCPECELSLHKAVADWANSNIRKGALPEVQG